MVEIKFIKDTKLCKIGQVVETSDEEARLVVNEGYAVYKRLEELKEAEQKEAIPTKKQEEIKEIITNYFDKSDLAEQIYQVQPYYFDKGKNWWLWNDENKCWEIVDKTDMLIIVKKISTLNTVNGKEKTEIIEAMEQYGRAKKPMDVKPTWIQFLDTIVDIKTGEKLTASPEYFVVNPIPHKLGTSEETPTIDALFKDWVYNDKDGSSWTKTLNELAAYCLLPDYPISTCCALLGGGRNGKSTYQTFLERLVGKSNITTANLKKLVKERFEAWRLYKKLVCLMGEIDFGILKDTDTFKRLTGGDNMDFESKGKDGITARTYAKLIIACNQLPESFDKSEGYFRRWLIIDFPHNFEEKPHFLDIISEEEYQNFCLKATRILKELLERGTFTNQGTIGERERRYEERSNPFNMFLKEYCEIGENNEIPFWKLYDVYIDFLKQRNFRVQSKIEFNRALKSRGIKISNPRPTGKVNSFGKEMSWTYSMGLKLKDEYETMEEIHT